jgi:hypothetical protein
VRFAFLETTALFFAAHRKPELGKVNPAAHEVALEFGDLAHEFVILFVAAESHDSLNAGAVVPGSVEHGDLTPRREVFDVALEIPLAALYSFFIRILCEMNFARTRPARLFGFPSRM